MEITGLESLSSGEWNIFYVLGVATKLHILEVMLYFRHFITGTSKPFVRLAPHVKDKVRNHVNS